MPINADGSYELPIPVIGFFGTAGDAATEIGLAVRDIAAFIGPTATGAISVLNLGVKGDGVTDDTAALQAAVNTYDNLLIPNTGHDYILTNYINIPTGKIIKGSGNPTLKATNPSQPRIFRVNASADVYISDMRLDGAKAGKVSGHIATVATSDNVCFERLKIVDPKGAISISSSTFCRVRSCVTSNGDSSAVILDNSSDCEVSHLKTGNNANFGVFLLNGSHHNLIFGCETLDNGLELIGVRYDCHDNRIICNHAEGTGDNGISITGYKNTVVGNICTMNYHAGIWLYGHHNSCCGNTVYNNGQRYLVDATDWAGIQLQSDFGGYSHNNSVAGNVVFDDQASMTQIASIWVRNSYYGTWGAGKTITSTVGTYWTNGLNIYFSSAPAGSVTGSTPPTHTSGTVSDGAIDWTFVNTFPVSATARNNHIAINPCGAGRGSSEILIETAGNNTIFQNNVQEYTGWRSLAGDWIALAASRRYRRTTSAWATSQAIVYGDARASGNNIYRCINAGGTTSGTAPSHTSGTVTGADGIQWLFLYTDLSQSHALVQFEQDGFRLMHREIIQAIDGSSFCYRMAGLGSPEGKVAAPVSSTYHRTDGAAGTCFYVKESGTGNTGWVAK